MPELPAPYRSVYDRAVTREEVIAGCRALADLLEEHPTMPSPTFLGFDLYVGRDWQAGDDAPDTRRDRVAETLRALPGTFTRHEREDGYMVWQGTLGGILVTLRTEREAVCERVVLGVETVEVDASPEVVIPARPGRTEEREVVEWRCAPVLTEAPAGAPS